MESLKHFVSITIDIRHGTVSYIYAITKLVHYLLGTEVAEEPQDNLSNNLADLTPDAGTIAMCIKHLGTLNMMYKSTLSKISLTCI